jgi:hypothetical protein
VLEATFMIKVREIKGSELTDVLRRYLASDPQLRGKEIEVIARADRSGRRLVLEVWVKGE